MSKPVNLYDARTQLSKLVDRAAAGEEIITADPVIGRYGVPVLLARE